MHALFIVRASNHDEGEWVQYIIAGSPGEAVDVATQRKPWLIGKPISVEMPMDFIDVRAEKDTPNGQ